MIYLFLEVVSRSGTREQGNNGTGRARCSRCSRCSRLRSQMGYYRLLWVTMGGAVLSINSSELIVTHLNPSELIETHKSFPLFSFHFKRLCLFGAIFGDFGECGYYRDFGEKPHYPHYPHYPLCPHSSLYKPPRSAHHTFEAKLRNASTLLRLGKTKKSCFALTLIAKFTFHLSLFSFFLLSLYNISYYSRL